MAIRIFVVMIKVMKIMVLWAKSFQTDVNSLALISYDLCFVDYTTRRSLCPNPETGQIKEAIQLMILN